MVGQDALLDKVWPDTIVSPNTLQRSIAQLRKALGDDGKSQSYIKTHAKQGYSLECDVRWQDQTNSIESNSSQVNDEVDETPFGKANSRTDTTKKPQYSNHSLRLISIVVAIIILGIIDYQYLAQIGRAHV